MVARLLVPSLLLALVSARALDECRIPLLRHEQQAPVVDGKMQGNEWQYALAMTGLISLDGPLAQRQATVYYVADRNWLCVGMSAPAVPPGTVPEVKKGPDYDGKSYMALAGNDRIEVKFSPPNATAARDFHIVADAAGQRYVEHITAEHRAIFPEFDYRGSFDEAGWTVEMRLPAAMFGRQQFGDGEPWRINFTLVRLWPLAYDGLAPKPHSLRAAMLAADAPAVRIERLGSLRQGKLDLALSVREYEGLVATPKETAYDERTLDSGGLELEGAPPDTKTGSVEDSSAGPCITVDLPALEAHDFYLFTISAPTVTKPPIILD